MNWRRPAWALVSLIGLFGGHAIAFAIAAPSLQDNHRLLEATGHASPVPDIVVIALVVAVAILAAPRRIGVRGIATVCLLQIAAFCCLELSERLTVDSATALASDPVFHLGLVIQLLAGVAAGFVLLVGQRLITAARAVRSGGQRPSGAWLGVLPEPSSAATHFVDPSWTNRGPPPSLLYT